MTSVKWAHFESGMYGEWHYFQIQVYALVKSLSLSKLAMIKIFKVSIARSSAPVPVCNFVGLHSILMFLFLQKPL